MPTYGYECLSCANQFETFQSIKDDPLTTCDACGGTLRKRVYPVGIAFKGSGFYVNDYAPKSSNSAPKADAPAATTDAAPAVETKTADAPAPKAEAKAEKNPPPAPPAVGGV